MTLEHTSIPRWGATVTPDPSARSVCILSFGDEGRAVADGWMRQARATSDPQQARRVRTLHAARADDALLERLSDEVERATVGWRLLLAGPEADVLLARATALRLGAVPAEVAAQVTTSGVRRVLCAHCDAVTSGEVAVGGTQPCDGCGRSLVVHHHVSRRLAAYLGYLADAEEA